jgi:hypothetical protein
MYAGDCRDSAAVVVQDGDASGLGSGSGQGDAEAEPLDGDGKPLGGGEKVVAKIPAKKMPPFVFCVAAADIRWGASYGRRARGAWHSPRGAAR